MTKLKAVLIAAAALVAAGVAVPLALNQAGIAEGMTPRQWCKAAQRANDIQKREHFYVAVAQGAEIPKESGGRLLGECQGGTCMVKPGAVAGGFEWTCTVYARNKWGQLLTDPPVYAERTSRQDGFAEPSPESDPEDDNPCLDAWTNTGRLWGCPVTYDYDCGPLVNGWRVCELYAHPYFAKGWRNEAAANVDFRWFGSLGDVVDECRAHFTGAQCLDLLQADRRCWLLDDGRVCRFGSVLGEDAACPYATVLARLPCVVYRGAGSEMQDVQRVWTDEEMDQL